MRTYSQALSYLESFVDYEKKPPGKYDDKTYDLSRVGKLLSYLGNPHNSIRSIHIAGTNGKGSTGAILTCILKEAGFKVGFYSSPHLVSFRERIRIGTELISEERMCHLTNLVKSAIEKLPGDGFSKPSFFEAYTVLAILYFATERVDFAVVEAGLGGRLDATNVLKPVVSIITSIEIDHEDQLGKTRPAIAREKSGIIKEEIPVITCSQRREVFNVIREKCEQVNSPLTEVRMLNSNGMRKDSSCSHEVVFLEKESVSLEGGKFRVYMGRNSYDNLLIPLLGEHQVLNAGMAVAAAQLLRVEQTAIRAGLKQTSWPGRLQIFPGRPSILLDGAHNPSAARALANAIKTLFGGYELTLILGVSSDKDIKGIGRELIPVASKLILTKANSPRAAEPVYLKRQLADLAENAEITNSSTAALKLALEGSSGESLICVSGSLFLVGEVLQYIQNRALLS